MGLRRPEGAAPLRVEALEKAWRDQAGAARLAPTMAFGPDGLTLGAGTVLAPVEDLGSDDPLAAAAEARLHALLSAAYRRSIEPQAIGFIRRGAMSWRAGDKAMAAMHLAMTGLLPLRNPKDDARRLFMADALMKAGAEPETILRALDLGDVGGEAFKRYDPDQPRNPAGSGRASGQWAREGTPHGARSANIAPEAAASPSDAPPAKSVPRRTTPPSPTPSYGGADGHQQLAGDMSTPKFPAGMQLVALKPNDKCLGRATPLISGGPQSAISLSQLNTMAAFKFIQHSFPLNPITGQPQGVFGGDVKNPAALSLFAAQLVGTYANVPAPNNRVRITGNLGRITGRDKDSDLTSYLTMILSSPNGRDENGIPRRAVISLYPGC